MKIMQIIPVFSMGGGEIMCETLTTELVRRGHQVLAVSLYSDETDITRRLQKSGIDVRFLGKKRGLDLSCLFRLRRLIRRWKPDVIHTHLYALKYAALAKAFLRIPGVHTIHNVAEREATGNDQKLNRFFYRRRMALPVSLSDEVQGTVTALYRLPPERCPVILNGVDLTKCTPKTGYAPHDPIRLIHVGRFSEQKNHECIIDAVSKLPRGAYRVDLWGEGERLDEIRDRVAQSGLADEIIFNGTTTDTYRELSASDIFLLPSKWEGVPMSIIEAMGTGLPIIASAVGGVPDMLMHEHSALLIRPNAGELKAAIERLAGSETLRRTLGTNALSESRRFSASEMAQRYEALYLTLLK
ncbi:MAG: glycosyltransferase family 4 protein [Clostridia bacterium]|nr:glycosyltransferase family 4 protein [Clostridia bacterium]